MKTQWKKGTFRIAMNPRAMQLMGDDGNRSGLICAPWAINKMGGGFALTALANGLKVGDFDRLNHAKDVAGKLLDLPVDWTATNPLHDVSADVQKQALAIMRHQYHA